MKKKRSGKTTRTIGKAKFMKAVAQDRQAAGKQMASAFMDAVVQDRKRAEQMLRQHPELLEARVLWGETVLHYLAVENQLDGVRFLAEAGANINAVDRHGEAVLIHAAQLGRLEVVKILLHHGADPNTLSVIWDNALCAAIHSGNAQLVDSMIAAGARLDGGNELLFKINFALPQNERRRKEVLAVLGRHGIQTDDEGCVVEDTDLG